MAQPIKIAPIPTLAQKGNQPPHHKRMIVLRTIMPVLLTVGLVLIAFFYLFLPMMRDSIMEQKRELLRAQVQTVWQLLYEYEQRANTGEISQQEAQRRAKARIRNLRYGQQGKDYFWINDMHPTMIMHPYRTDLEGKDITNFIDAANKPLFLRMVQTVEKNEDGFVEYLWQWQDDPGKIVPKLSYVIRFRPWNWVIGTGIYIEDVKQQIHDSTQKSLGWFAVIFSIVFLLSFYVVYQALTTESERAAAEIALRQSRQQLADILDSLPDATMVIDKDGYVTAWNHAIERMTGITAEEMIGKGHYEYALPFYGSRRPILCDLILLDDLDSEKRYANVHRNDNILIGETYTPTLADGERYLLGSAATLHDTEGNVIGAIEIIRDITDKKLTEDKVRQSEENLRITMDSIGDAVIATDDQGRIKQMNPVAERLTGFRFSEINGHLLSEIFHIKDAETGRNLPDPIGRVLETGESVGMGRHSILTNRMGNSLKISDSASAIRNREGMIVGVVLVFRDITEQSQLEEQLRQSQKMEAIGQLAGGVAHDFNNMLGGIMGAAEILAVRLEGQETHRKYVNLIMETAERAGELTDKLLSFSRKGKTLSTPVDLHVIIDDTLALLERSIDRRIKLEKHLTSPHSHVVGDPAQLQSAILNLGINARDAMPEGGQITLSTEEVDLDDSYCQASPFKLSSGKFIRMSIRDTGVGIPPEIQERIFEPFFTTKSIGKGTGLGLAAVFGTVNDHHGAINVYSEIDVGTVFHIYLPLEDAPKQPHKSAPEIISTSGCILLVDDEAIIRSTGAMILQDMGFKVLLAENGKQCIEIFEQHKDEIDIVLLDLVMPEMNGKEVFLALRRILPDIRVIMSSGFSRSPAMDLPEEEARVGFIKKPYLRADLQRVLTQIL